MREAGAGVMADEGAGVRGWLLQLQEFLSAADRCSAAGASYQLIRGLGQECVLSTSSAVLGGYGPRVACLSEVSALLSLGVARSCEVCSLWMCILFFPSI